MQLKSSDYDKIIGFIIIVLIGDFIISSVFHMHLDGAVIVIALAIGIVGYLSGVKRRKNKK